MKVTLRKIGKTPLDFEIDSDKITFKGFLQYHSGKLILLKADLKGKFKTQCSRCGDDFELDVDEKVEFFISDGLYQDDDNLELDVVESLNSIVDLDELLNSELELIKCDYNSCENCKDL